MSVQPDSPVKNEIQAYGGTGVYQHGNILL